MNVQAQLSWLCNISDRLLANTQLRNSYSNIKFDNALFNNEGVRSWSNSSVLSSNLTYFIQNRLGLDAGLSYSLWYLGYVESDSAFDVKNTAFLFNAGLRYYFSRNLY